MRRNWSRSLLTATILMLVVLVTGGPAMAAPPIDWRIRTTFLTADGDDVPLRYGQHDEPGRDGFGWYHIMDGRGVGEEQYEHIKQKIEFVLDACRPKFNSSTRKATCRRVDTKTEATYTVVITDRHDSRSPSRPVGVITYSYDFGCGC